MDSKRGASFLLTALLDIRKLDDIVRSAWKHAEASWKRVSRNTKEIEKGLAGMKGSGELDSGVGARVVATILTWRQETTKPVFVVATANEVSSLPSMVYRKGRLTYKSRADVKQLKLLETPKAGFATARLVTANANA